MSSVHDLINSSAQQQKQQKQQHYHHHHQHMPVIPGATVVAGGLAAPPPGTVPPSAATATTASTAVSASSYSSTEVVVAPLQPLQPPSLPLPLPLPLPLQPPPQPPPPPPQPQPSSSTSFLALAAKDGPPQPISRWGFEYNGTLTWKGIVRRDASYLKSICFPEQEADLLVRKRAQEEAAKTLTIKFISAQLNHYGVQFPPGIKRDGLLTWLKGALSRDQCDRVPDYLEDRIQGMIKDFEPRREAYEAWTRAEDRQAMREHFNSLPTITMQVSYDVGLFMETYFTDEAGNPAPLKYISVLTIPKVLHPWEVVDAVSKVPNLFFTFSQLHSDDTLFISWNHAAMWEAREAYDASRGRQRKLDRETRGRDRMARHKEYIEIIERTQVRQEFSLVGSYALFCDSIEEQTGAPPAMMLDILQGSTLGTYEGVFRFSVMVAILTLAPDVKDLDVVELEERRRFGPARLDDVQAEEPQLQPPPQPYQQVYVPPGWPQGMPFPQQPEPQAMDILGPGGTVIMGAGSKRAASEAGRIVPAGPSKKPKVNYSNNVQKRFTATWHNRGDSDEIASDYPHSADGWIEYEDGRYLSFSGILIMPFAGGERTLRGYKVSDVPRKSQTIYA